MEERAMEAEYDFAQYFLSDCDWDWFPINEQVAQDCDKLLEGCDDRTLCMLKKAAQRPTCT